jgi:hypothetical protein
VNGLAAFFNLKGISNDRWGTSSGGRLRRLAG